MLFGHLTSDLPSCAIGEILYPCNLIWSDRVRTEDTSRTIPMHYRRIEDDYESLSQVLGTGYNGEVKLARCKHTGEKYAVKAFKLRGVSKEKRKELESEAEIFLAMDHPHVAALSDVPGSSS